MKKPNGGNKILKNTITTNSKTQSLFDNELEFYQYYRSGSTLDYKYFPRGEVDIKLALDSIILNRYVLATSHDFKVAKTILANDLIELYLETSYLC